MTTIKSYSTAELAAFYYLTIPVLIFFLGFTRIELAILASNFIFYCIYSITRSTRFNLSFDNVSPLGFFSIYSTIVIILSGCGNFFYHNEDWIKHFAVINHLIDYDWPTTVNRTDGETDTLRYTIGWYLPSALLLKMTGWTLQDITLGLWSATGLIIFFFLLKEFIPSRRDWLLAPIIFLFFSGMDFLGGQIFQWFSHPADVAWWNGAHIEWWSGWMSYSSMISLLFWTPQHAISAWLATALIMRAYQTGNNLQHIMLVMSCVMLTSAFATLGLLPFILALTLRHGIKKLFFNWSSFLSVVLIAIPLASYLTAFTGNIPHGLIWSKYCDPTATGCFSIKSYLLVMLMEVIPFVVLLFIAEKQWRLFIAIGGLFLLLLPMIHMGLYNDIVMRASIPAIAFIAILSAKVVLENKSYASSILLIILAIGSFTPAGEIIRAVTLPYKLSDQTTFEEMPNLPSLYPQYFAPKKIWMLDSP